MAKVMIVSMTTRHCPGLQTTGKHNVPALFLVMARRTLLMFAEQCC